jgi:hypothetical protein
MNHSDRKRAHLEAPVRLESRRLLAAPQIVGNVGQVLISQFQPYGFGTTVGSQLLGVKLRGSIKINIRNDSSPAQSSPSSIVNSGLINRSQFNGGGFHTVGLQLDNVQLGAGLTVSGFDNEDAGLPPTTPILPTLPNRNVISNSQFNDGGFGTLEARADGSHLTREGRIGLQWRKTRVHGPVDIELDDDIVQPEAKGDSPTVANATPNKVVGEVSVVPGQKIIDFTTNSGLIRNSQFNDGGFGDIGMQWSKVKVGGRVGTATNTLFIKPQQDNYGPITIKDRIFGQATESESSTVNGQSALNIPSDTVGALATESDVPFRTTYTNSASNSGKILQSQVNEGGFGDIGLQWKNVRVGGNVTAAHNSLTVQPENKGQGLITVQGVRFPIAPPVTPQPEPSPLLAIPADPSIVVMDGDPVTSLPKPTGPLSPFFPIPFAGSGTKTIPDPGEIPLVNAASNSGLIQSSQVNTGAFGDQGLQWKDVRVRGDVKIVHNSLSVHPEGSKLEGISVSDVAYGPPITPSITRHFAVLPYAVISPATVTAASSKNGGEVLHPPNDRILTNQQLAAASGTDVFLQWNGIEHRRGLVIVHNIIQITGVGPQTGPITLTNIRFPLRIPPLGSLKTTAVLPTLTVKAPEQATRASVDPSSGQLLNSANNSGILDNAQFSDGGFGDDGLQWRNVSVAGSVMIVHNTLAVDATADLPPGDVAGPITITGVSFNSGALKGDLSRQTNQVVVTPPDVFQRVSSHPINLGKALPKNPAVSNDSTNSGIMVGGQLAAGGAKHSLLQWQCVRISGKVRVIDNVLSISLLDRPSGPIQIADVTFA